MIPTGSVNSGFDTVSSEIVILLKIHTHTSGLDIEGFQCVIL